MVLNDYRPQADKYLIPIATRFKDIHPNTFSWLALLAAGIAGVLLWQDLLLVAFIFLFLNSLLDALDGKVARLTKNLTKQGDFLDHVIDRYSDVFILLGIGFSSFSTPFIGFMAIIGVLLTSYIGTQIQASGAKRDYGGLMGRADRLVFLMLAILLQGAHQLAEYFGLVGFRLPLLFWAMVLFAILNHLTAAQRFYRAWRTLGEYSPREE